MRSSARRRRSRKSRCSGSAWTRCAEFARLSRLKFDKGVAGYLEVLIAENELFAAELASVSLLAARYAQLVSVYQAMGGGWVDIAGSLAPRPQGIAAAPSPQ